MPVMPEILSSGGHEMTEADFRYGIFLDLDAKARRIEEVSKQTWVETAEIAQAMEDGSYWKEGKYTSFSSWLRTAMPCSYSWARLAMSVRKDLKEMHAEDLAKMPLANAEVIRRMQPPERKKVLKTAQTTTPEVFLPTIVAERPELALELKVKLHFTTTASQATVIKGAIQMWLELHSERIKDVEALEYICAGYMNEHRPEWEVVRDGHPVQA